MSLGLFLLSYLSFFLFRISSPFLSLSFFFFLHIYFGFGCTVSHCFAWALSSCGEWERPFVPACGLLSVPAPGAELGRAQRVSCWHTGPAAPRHVGSSDSYPLHHQGSPCLFSFGFKDTFIQCHDHTTTFSNQPAA